MNSSRKLHDAEVQGARTAHDAARLKSNRPPSNRNAAHDTHVSAHPNAEQQHASNRKARTGIVSVNGRDVGEMRCTGRHRA